MKLTRISHLNLGRNKKPLLQAAIDLDRYLFQRHVPMERDEKKAALKHCQRQVMAEAGVKRFEDLGIK